MQTCLRTFIATFFFTSSLFFFAFIVSLCLSQLCPSSMPILEILRHKLGLSVHDFIPTTIYHSNGLELITESYTVYQARKNTVKKYRREGKIIIIMERMETEIGRWKTKKGMGDDGKERERERQTDRQQEGQREREKETEIQREGREIETQAHREIQRHRTDTEREREGERHRKRVEGK